MLCNTIKNKRRNYGVKASFLRRRGRAKHSEKLRNLVLCWGNWDRNSMRFSHHFPSTIGWHALMLKPGS
jgi:hypothetical protein